MRILVTGGAGFIGSHLCERFAREGHAVLALDNRSSAGTAGSHANLAAIAENPGFRFALHDVCDTFEAEVDRIYHLACPASPLQYQADPLRTLRTSVLGTMNMLELAKRTGARFLFASTSEVYGDPEVHPQPESYWGHVNPVGPRACYDEGKRCAETFTVEYGTKVPGRTAVDVRIARIFNTYGPRMAGDGRVVPTFIRQALRGEDITMFGDGSQTRSFCFIDDMVEGLSRLMEHPGFHGPINLGNPEEVTIADLATSIISHTRSQSRIVRRDLPPDDPKRRKPDISAAQRLLGFEPKVTLADGIAATVADVMARESGAFVLAS